MRKITRDDRDRIRDQFPALKGDTIFFENAGGSQVPAVVADGIRDYMLSSYVQLGAGYPLSEHCTELVDAAHEFVRLLMNGDDGEVILGPSTSALLQMLAGCYSTLLTPGSEIVVAQTGHEANVGPWKNLERFGFPIRWWEMDPATCTCPLERLEELLNERTALVAFPHVSNLLGDIVDVRAITELVHAAGARVVVDGVAYAPHRAMDVAAWDVDWYAFRGRRRQPRGLRRNPRFQGLHGVSCRHPGVRGRRPCGGGARLRSDDRVRAAAAGPAD